MRRLEVAALALLVAGAALVLLALCRDRRCRRRGSSISSNRPAAPELPLSTTPRAPATKGWRQQQQHHVALLLLLCSGRRRHLRARVEPAAAPPGSRTTTTTEEEMADRWFGGHVSLALYTIYEEEEPAGAGEWDGQETETPFYTPPASPPRDAGGGGGN